MSKAFKGVDKFFVAEIESDTTEGIVYRKPYQLSAIQHVTREDSKESAKVFGDNKVQFVVKGEGTQSATFTTFCLDPVDLAKLLGHKTVGKAMVVTNRAKDKYFGIMYRLKNTDGTYNYVALAKGKFLAPSEDVETENDGTDVTLMELQVELLSTVAEFETDSGEVDTEGNPVMEMASYRYLQLKQEVGENYETSFFEEMQTPDTVKVLQGLATA